MAAKKAAKSSARRRGAAASSTRPRARSTARRTATARKTAAKASKKRATGGRKAGGSPTASRKTTARRKQATPKKAAAKKRQSAAQRRLSAPRAARPKARQTRTAGKAARKAKKTASPPRVARKPSTTRKRPAAPRRQARRPATAPVQTPDVAIPSELTSPGSPLGEARRRQSRPATGLARERRQLPAAERGEVEETPTLDDSRLLASARSGRRELNEALRLHTEATPDLTAGDIDARWEDAYAVGDEAPGGDNPTPDQDRVEDIGRALGLTYEDNEELEGGEKIVERDRHRWELDPASSDDWPHNQD